MANMNQFCRRKTFYDKAYGNFVYNWKPDLCLKKKIGNDYAWTYKLKPDLSLCKAPAGSTAGYDENVEYVYDPVTVDGVTYNVAYVTCDYVD